MTLSSFLLLLYGITGIIVSNFRGGSMEFLVFISYVFFAFLLFLGLNYLSAKFTITKLEYIIFTNIYLLVIAGLFSCVHLPVFCDNIFIIIVFEFLIRMLYTTYLLDKDFFAKEDGILPLYLKMIVVSYLLNQLIIRHVKYVFLDAEQMKFVLWVLIFFFLYQFFQKRTNTFTKRIESSKTLVDKDAYIYSQYAKMKRKYGPFISVQDDLRFAIYALMIYENYYRPSFFRNLDYFRFQFDHVPKKQGIMQVDSKKILTDMESIEVVEKKLIKLYDKLKDEVKTKKSTTDFGLLTLQKYVKNADSLKEVLGIYKKLKEFSVL